MEIGIFFALLSPAIYSIVNYFDKFFLERYKIEPVVITIFSAFIALIISIIILFIFGLHIYNYQIILSIIISGILTELYILPYFNALSLEDASTVMPLAQFSPLFIIIGGAFIFGETLSFIQYIGGFVIILSGLVLSLERVNVYFFRPRRAFWHMIIACMLIALATLFFKYGLGIRNFWYILPYEGFGIFVGALLLLIIPSNIKKFNKSIRRMSKKVYSLMFINELLFIFARYCGFFALSFISVSLVGILAGLQPLFVLIYGVILSIWFPYIIKEVITKKTLIFKLVAILFIILGTILLIH